MTRATAGSSGLRLLLVVMPFVSLKRPVLAASLLKSIVNDTRHECDVVYPAFDWAQEIGVPFYEFVATRTPTQHLVGEWIFAEAAFGDDAPSPSRYVDEILLWQDIYPQDVISKIQGCRSAAPSFIARVADEIEWTAYDAVGFTTSFQQNVASLALANEIKARHPTLVTLFGGANVEGQMGTALHAAFPSVDIVVSGEADQTLPLVLDRLEVNAPLDDVRGITFRASGQSQTTAGASLVDDLDRLPLADHDDWHQAFVARGIEQHIKPQVTMETSRGCWWGERHQCTFCGLNGGSMAYRAKSPQRAFDEITSLREAYPHAGIFATDNILNLDYFRSLFPRLIEDGVNVDLSYETKSSLRKSQLVALRELGTTWFQPGIESLSTPVLHLMDKGTRAINNVQLLKWARELRLGVTWNIISGFPGETAEAYEEMLRTVRLIGHLCPPASFAQFRLDRFSPLFERSHEFGLDPVAPHPAYSACYPLPIDTLHSLAYFFEHSYSVPNEIRVVLYELWLEVEKWKSAYPTSSLTAVVTPAFVYIDDRRWGRQPEQHLLAGLERSVYIAADRVQSIESLMRVLTSDDADAPSETAVRGVLGGLVARGLMMREADAYLSLAVLRTELGARRKTSLSQPIPVVAA